MFRQAANSKIVSTIPMIVFPSLKVRTPFGIGSLDAVYSDFKRKRFPQILTYNEKEKTYEYTPIKNIKRIEPNTDFITVSYGTHKQIMCIDQPVLTSNGFKTIYSPKEQDIISSEKCIYGGSFYELCILNNNIKTEHGVLKTHGPRIDMECETDELMNISTIVVHIDNAPNNTLSESLTDFLEHWNIKDLYKLTYEDLRKHVPMPSVKHHHYEPLLRLIKRLNN